MPSLCYWGYLMEFDFLLLVVGAFIIVEMLYRSSFLAIVGAGEQVSFYLHIVFITVN